MRRRGRRGCRRVDLDSDPGEFDLQLVQLVAGNDPATSSRVPAARAEAPDHRDHFGVVAEHQLDAGWVG
jgi:hypothetical protein